MLDSELFEKSIKQYQAIWRQLYSNGPVNHSKIQAFYASWDNYLQENSITHGQWLAAIKDYVLNIDKGAK